MPGLKGGTSIELRLYQQETISAVRKRQAEGVTRQLVVLPTGTGKTVVFVSLAKQMNCRTLIVAHREELINQAADKCRMVWPGADVGVVMADRDEYDRQVVIASIQSASRPKRIERLQEQDFKLIVIDEAHHATATTYIDIIKGLGFMDNNPDKLLTGYTATARRGDKIGLRNVFQEIVFERSIAAMTKAGYLSDLRGIRVSTGLDLDHVATRHGDFIESQLSSVVNCVNRNEIIRDTWLEHAADRRTLAFTVDVQHALDVAATFQDAGIPAEAVYGDMPKQNRHDLLQAFHNGEVKVLTNCNLLVEGFDEPATDCLLMARPTKSTGLYIQMAGRGTRLYPGKQDCLVIDFTDSRHDVCMLGTLAGFDLRQGQSVREAIEEQEKRQNRSKELLRSMPVTAQSFDVLDKSLFRWIQAGTDWRLPLEPGCFAVLRHIENDSYRVGIIKDRQAFALSELNLPLGYALGVAEDYARKNTAAFARKDAAWREHPASPKQIDLLKKLGLYRGRTTKGQAADLLDKFFASKNNRVAL
ncbi:MAG: type I restriction enzyme EcoKI subunit R [Pelotomaculum sp. PtaB.Bin104]|nr:MAG: type I restriction enzyme EcoKI subunit R [Pelotomaculum sp. PtaB.Bin104]